MIPNRSQDKIWSDLDLDSALRTYKPTARKPIFLLRIKTFFSLRRLVACFYISLGVIVFIGFILSKDSFDEHRLVFDAVTLIEAPPQPSSSPSTKEKTTLDPLSVSEKHAEDEEQISQESTKGLIVRHPVAPLTEETPVPTPPSSMMSGPTNQNAFSSQSSEASSPNSNAVRFHSNIAPSWAKEPANTGFNPSSFDLPHEENKTKVPSSP
jgi:hypothetical protein